MHVLVFTTDVIPLPGLPTSGTALRTWGLIQGIRAHGHKVTISVPKNALKGARAIAQEKDRTGTLASQLKELQENSFDSINQQSIIQDLKPDVILCGHWPAMTLQSKPAQPLIIDLAGPHLLERHYQGMRNHVGAVLGKLHAISSADYFIVSGPKQRLYFMSFLLRAQIDQPEKRMVTIPMPLDPSTPVHPRGNGDYPHFIFGGVFLPWQNPRFALEHVAEALTERNQGKLTLIGGKHPNYSIDEGVYDTLFKNLSRNPRVETKPMLPYEKFVEELGAADVAVDLMSWNLERELAMTIRSTTYLWSGLPVIYNDFADLGSLIAKYDAGWCVPPENPGALRSVIDQIYSNPAAVRGKSANATRLARDLFSWDTAVEPLLQLFGSSSRARPREVDIIVDFPDSAAFPLIAGKSVEQQFVCRLDGLSRVECRLATHDVSPRDPITFSLFELEKNGSASGSSASRLLVAQQQIEGNAIKNNEWFALDLEPVQDSAGRSFVFRMESEASAKEGASPWAVKGQPYPLTSFSYGGSRIDHTALCLRTTCTGG